MQTDKNDMKVEKSVSMHWHAFERPCKRQIVTDTKSRNASHILPSLDERSSASRPGLPNLIDHAPLAKLQQHIESTS